MTDMFQIIRIDNLVVSRMNLEVGDNFIKNDFNIKVSFNI